MAWIGYVLIYEAFRNKGYAKKAHSLMEKKLKEKGINKVGLNVFAFNKPAKKLYEGLGYTVDREVSGKNSEDICRYEMSKTF